MCPANAELTYRVEGMSCGHCKAAVSEGVVRLPGVRNVDVDLDARLVHVQGANLDDSAIRAAIDEAGYDAEPA